MSTRICAKCKIEKPATAEHFRVDKESRDGLKNPCRECFRPHAAELKRTRRARLGGKHKPRTLVVLSDVHVPEHDKHVWATCMELLAFIRPSEVLLLGDFMELASVSLHGGAELEKLTDDFMAGKQALKQLRETVGADCLITYLEGNHESRLSRFLASKAPSLMESLSCHAGLGLKELDIEWVPEHKQPVSRGDLDLTHGHQDLRERPSKYHAAKMADIYGRPGRTILYGHTHKPQTFTRPMVGERSVAIGMGCGRTLAPGWLHGAQAGWAHQIAVVYLSGAGRCQVLPVSFHHGQAMWQGRLFGAVPAPTPASDK